MGYEKWLNGKSGAVTQLRLLAIQSANLIYKAAGYTLYGNCLKQCLETIRMLKMQKKRIWKLSEANRQNLITLIEGLDCQTQWQVTIQEAKDKDQRTLDQNRRYWD